MYANLHHLISFPDSFRVFLIFSILICRKLLQKFQEKLLYVTVKYYRGLQFAIFFVVGPINI